MRTAAGAFLAIVLAVSACSGDSDDTPSAAAPSSGSTSAGVTSAPAPSTTASATVTSTARRANRSATRPVPTSPVRTVTVDGEHDSYVIQVWAQVNNDSCYDHAYGQPVITYLTTYPCRGLTRVLASTVVDGRDVGVAQSSFSFSGAPPTVYKTAGNFRKLVDQDGTGNLRDLFREGYRMPDGPTSVPAPDAFSALSQDSAVTVVDAWYLDGPTPANDPKLERMAKDLFRRF